jgi:hypothetical protein
MRKASAYHEERVGGLDEALLLVLELLELRRRVEQVDVVLQHLFQYPPHKKSRSDAKNRIGSVDPHNKSGSKGEAARANERVGVPSWRRARWWRRVLGGEERREATARRKRRARAGRRLVERRGNIYVEAMDLERSSSTRCRCSSRPFVGLKSSACFLFVYLRKSYSFIISENSMNIIKIISVFSFLAIIPRRALFEISLAFFKQ